MVEGMLRERRSTCSTKHLFLAQALREHFPETEPHVKERAREALRPMLLRPPRGSSAGRHARRRLALPGVSEQLGQPVGVDSVEVYVKGAEALAPPELRARLGFALGGGEYSGVVEHHIHMVLIPEGCEDLARDAE